MPKRHDPYSSLRVPLFRRYLIASSLVRLGTAAQGLAIGWEVYDRTGQALSLGMVGLVQAIPMLLLTLPAGYLADVFDRRKLMMLSLAGATLCSLALAAFSWYQMPVLWMYWLLFLDSSFLRLGWPAQRAIAPLLVPDALFENAAKWSTSLMQITGIAGPAIGGAFGTLSEIAYALDAQIPVIGLHTWPLTETGEGTPIHHRIIRASDPADAAQKAIAAAQSRPG